MNDDLISRSALIAALENEKIRIAVDKGKMFGLIEAAPAVDAVEAVRCTECQYMKIKAGLCYCKVWQGYNDMGSDGFCNYGERGTE